MPSPTKPLTNGNRSSLSPDAAGAIRDGRTPPPAPSAVYAKRARELLVGETVPGAPVLDLGDDDDQGFGSAVYRRARAG